MQYIKNYSSISEKDADIVLPIMYTIGDNEFDVYYKGGYIELKYEFSVTFSTVKTQTNTVTDNGKTYSYSKKYTTSDTEIFNINFLSSDNSDKQFILKIGNNTYKGYVRYSSSGNTIYRRFVTPNFCIIYNYAGRSSQGGTVTVTQSIYSTDTFSLATMPIQIYLYAEQ